MKLTLMKPLMEFLREAIKAVPAVRYALGVGGIASVVAIISGFDISHQTAIFGTIFVIGLMFLLLVFSTLTKKSKALHLPALFLAWAFIFLSISASSLYVSSYFFKWPLDFTKKISVPKNISISKMKSVTICGTVKDEAGNPIKDAKITTDPNYNVKLNSDDWGYFSKVLKYGKNDPDEKLTITLNVWHSDYFSYKETREITREKEEFEVILKK